MRSHNYVTNDVEMELNVQTHDQLVKKLMRRSGVRAEVERIEREEGALLDALLKARREAGLIPIPFH